MTKENKKTDGGTGANIDNIDGASNNPNTETDSDSSKLKEELANEKKRSAGLDAKVTEQNNTLQSLKEKHEQDFLNSKTHEEQNKILADKIDTMNRISSFSSKGLDSNLCSSLFSEKNPETQATILQELILSSSKIASEEAVKKFKQEQNDIINKTPPKVTNLPVNEKPNANTQMLRAAAGLL